MSMRIGFVGLGHEARARSEAGAMIRLIFDSLPLLTRRDGLKQAWRARREGKFYKSLDEMVRQGKIDGLIIGARCPCMPNRLCRRRSDPVVSGKPVAINASRWNLERAFANSAAKWWWFSLRFLCAALTSSSPTARWACEHVLINYVAYGMVYWQQEYRNYEITQGLFLQKATHDLDYLSFLVDSPIVRIGAMGSFGRVYGGDKPSGLKCSECSEQLTCQESPHNRSVNNLPFAHDHPCVFSVDCGSPDTGTNEDCSAPSSSSPTGRTGFTRRSFSPDAMRLPAARLSADTREQYRSTGTKTNSSGSGITNRSLML